MGFSALALAALAGALAVVAWLWVDRARTRSVAIGQARRLALIARELRDANARLATTNEGLSAFGGRLAHDLRSPLGTVVTTLQTLLRPELALPHDVRERLLSQALRAAQRSVTTIEALLDHAASGGREAEVALVDVGELAADVVSTLPTATVGTVTIELPRGPARAWADPRLLSLVLQNLVANALLHGGGDLGRIAVATAALDHGVEVTVEDDGAGIPAARRDQLFAVGSAEGPTGGLGLGLATCDSIVARHGGRIWADDSELGGAAIRFTLPRPRPRQPRPTRPAEAGEAHLALATSSSSGSSSRTVSRS